MLLEQYNTQGLLSITSVLGATSDKTYAFRGDLVLQEGELREGSDRDRKPPVSVIHQAVALSGEDQLLFVGGLLYKLEQLALFVEKYKPALSADTIVLLYVEDIESKMKVSYEGLTFQLVPYPGGMVWNELLELLYIEKSDMKGQSAEDKVGTVYDAAKGFDTKTDAIGYDVALEQTIEVVKDLSVGPV